MHITASIQTRRRGAAPQGAEGCNRNPALRRSMPAFVLLLCGLTAGPAFAERAFSPRFFTNTRGEVYLYGNISIHCDEAQGAPCLEARAGGVSEAHDNNDMQMVNVDIDADPSTFNSSSAQVRWGERGSVIWAGLYWSGQSDDPAARSTVQFKGPGQGGYTTLTAPVTDVISFPGVDSYQSFRDVTRLVQDGGQGAYTVANVAVLESTTGGSSGGGWTIVIATSDPWLPFRDLHVFDGFLEAGSSPSTSQIDLTLTGVRTPVTGPVTGNVGIVTYDGDKGRLDNPGNPSLEFGADAGSLAPINCGTSPFSDINPRNNIYNSSISIQCAELIGDRVPVYRNTLGLDIDRFLVGSDPAAAAPIGNGATSALFRVSASPSDVVTMGVAVMTIDFDGSGAGIADLAVDAGATPGNVSPGETMTFQAMLANQGPDAAGFPGIGFAFDAELADLELSTPAGWSCDAPNVGGGATSIACAAEALAAGDGADFVATATAPVSADGDVITMTAAATSTTPDGELANNSDSVSVSVDAIADLAVAISGPPVFVRGTVASYTIELDNLGPATAPQASLAITLGAPAGSLALAAPAGWSCMDRPTAPYVARGFDCTRAGAAPVGDATFVVAMTVSNKLFPPRIAVRARAASAAGDPDQRDNYATLYSSFYPRRARAP